MTDEGPTVDLAEYRRAYEQELAAEARGRKTAKAAAAPSIKETVALISASGTRKRAARIAAIEAVADKALSKPTVMKALIAVLADPKDKPDVRRAALALLHECLFSATAFRRYDADFRAALRTAAEDPDDGLREGVLDLLALQKDEYAQRLLIDGLKEPGNALVPPERALRMIAYDLHSDHLALLRDVVTAETKPTVRRTALRLLAADSDSEKLFEGIAADPKEDREARATSAMALQSLAPERFAKLARRVVLDEDDDDDVRATFLSGLAHGPAEVNDNAFGKRVRTVQSKTASKQLRRSAEHYIESTDVES